MHYITIARGLLSLSCAYGKSLLNYLAAHPSLYIDEQVYYLWDTFSIQVNEQCIRRMLKRVKSSKKKVLYTRPFNPIFSDLFGSEVSFIDATTCHAAESGA